MYTLVIADDEENLRQEIIKKINWESIGFQVTGEAENGIEALDQVEKKEPDLLLTDIKMPFLSGIELARQVREIRPAMSIAFLTGYDDFKLAQQAIQYNIISYLLKPISAEELTNQMIQIREKMDKRIGELKQAGISQDSDENRMKAETAAFLMPLLLDNAQIYPGEREETREETQLRDRAKELGILRSETNLTEYAVMITMLDQRNPAAGSKGNVPGQDRTAFVDEILKKYVEHGSFYSNGKIVSLIAGSGRDLDKYVPILTKEIVQNAKRYINCKCDIGVSRNVGRMLDCRSAYLEALTAAGYSRTGDDDIYFIADIEKEAGSQYAQAEDLIDELETLIKGSDRETLSCFLNNLFNQIQGYDGRLNVQFLILQIVTRVYQSVSAVMEEETAMKLQTKITFFNKIFIDDSFDRIKDEAIDFCMTARDLICDQRKMNSKKLCEQVLSTIQNEYKDPSLSIASLSKTLHVSPNYLSAVIKKQTGDTFTNLLSRKRMEMAREYLACTSMKVLEISANCGYTDQHYFSYCFKKYYGMSPNKMRETAV